MLCSVKGSLVALRCVPGVQRVLAFYPPTMNLYYLDHSLKFCTNTSDREECEKTIIVAHFSNKNLRLLKHFESTFRRLMINSGSVYLDTIYLDTMSIRQCMRVIDDAVFDRLLNTYI